MQNFWFFLTTLHFLLHGLQNPVNSEKLNKFSHTVFLLHLLRRRWRVKLRFVGSCSSPLSFCQFLLKSLLTNRRIRSSFSHWITPTFPTPSRSIVWSSSSSTHHGMFRFCSSSCFNSTCACPCLNPKKSWNAFHSQKIVHAVCFELVET